MDDETISWIIATPPHRSNGPGWWAGAIRYVREDDKWTFYPDVWFPEARRDFLKVMHVRD